MQNINYLNLVALIMVLFLVLPGFLRHTRRIGLKTLYRNILLWAILGLAAALFFTMFGGRL